MRQGRSHAPKLPSAPLCACGAVPQPAAPLPSQLLGRPWPGAPRVADRGDVPAPRASRLGVCSSGGSACMRMRKLTCGANGGSAERWHTFGARVRDCRHEGRSFAAGFERLVETRLPIPNALDETPGREEQVAGNVQGYVRVLHCAVAGESGVAAGVRWKTTCMQVFPSSVFMLLLAAGPLIERVWHRQTRLDETNKTCREGSPLVTAVADTSPERVPSLSASSVCCAGHGLTVLTHTHARRPARGADAQTTRPRSRNVAALGDTRRARPRAPEQL